MTPKELLHSWLDKQTANNKIRYLYDYKERTLRIDIIGGGFRIFSYLSRSELIMLAEACEWIEERIPDLDGVNDTPSYDRITDMGPQG